MKIVELFEGGWDTTKTQSTVLHPKIVGVALQVVDKFVSDFNKFLSSKNIPPVKRGKPTGSSAYHEIDSKETPEKVYGDIDLQMIGSKVEGASAGQFSSYWNNLANEFVNTTKPNYVDTSESKPGHPIFSLGNDQYVQVDFMWHPEELATWGAARVTPERNVKGLLFGNMFSVFGELMDLSIQHAGVQLKVVDGKQVPFSKQKDTKIITVSTDPETFVLDTFNYLAQQMGIKDAKGNSMLTNNPGNKLDDVKISNLVNSVKGFATSAEENGMFGQGALSNFSSAQDFLNKFISRYEEKAMIDVQGKKRDKAQTPDAIARANADKEKILKGLEMVKGLF
jgi:hypothetical protein